MEHHYPTYIAYLIIAGTTAALFAARKILFNTLHRVARKRANQTDEFFVTALEGPATLLVIALALYIGLRLAEIPEQYEAYAVKGMHLSLILTVTMGLANISGRAVIFFLKKVDLPISVTSLLNVVIKTCVYAVGVLIMLNFVGISIAPIITALGVGGLAMALALQDTLSNLFAGIHILAEHTIRVGDYIRLETGQEGFVEDISWRTTRIRVPTNNMVIVPNSKLSQSVVTNYFLPERRTMIQVSVSVSCNADVDLVERALLEEATRSIAEVPGLLGDPAPSVLFVPGFGPSSFDFTLFCSVMDINAQQPVQHALRKRILKRFVREGITIPYPTQTVILQDTASKKGIRNIA
jgi:small-conductance mechanosensitive channel